MMGTRNKYGYLGCNKNDRFVENEIFNLIIFEDISKVLFYNFPEQKIYKIAKGSGLSELSFKEAVREIDIIPSKLPEWKRKTILELAKELGFFGIS